VARPARGRVYSTLHGRTCPRCGWPVKECRCARPEPEAVPDRITVRIRTERAGRRGKTVTVVEGLPANPAFLDGLLRELKRSCGSGGTVRERAVEIQGDQMKRIRTTLTARGWTVKG